MALDDTLILARTAHELRVPLSLISGSLDALAQYTDTMLTFISALEAKPLSIDEQRSLQGKLRLAYATAHVPEVLDICREGARRLTHVVERLRVSGLREIQTLQPVPLAEDTGGHLPAILVLDDEPSSVNLLRITLGMDYEIYTATGGADALELLERHAEIGVAIVDQRMPEMTGVEFVKHTVERFPHVTRIWTRWSRGEHRQHLSLLDQT